MQVSLALDLLQLIWIRQHLGWEFQEDEENVSANNIQASSMIKMSKSSLVGGCQSKQRHNLRYEIFL
jgi:hypothetical protein